MNFKSTKQESEFAALELHNKDLKNILVAIDEMVGKCFHKQITITDIYRTRDEMAAIYASVPKDKRPISSPHMFWSAADLRSFTFTPEEISTIVAYANTFKKGNIYRLVGLCHTIPGNVEHFHIQYRSLENTE